MHCLLEVIVVLWHTPVQTNMCQACAHLMHKERYSAAPPPSKMQGNAESMTYVHLALPQIVQLLDELGCIIPTVSFAYRIG